MGTGENKYQSVMGKTDTSWRALDTSVNINSCGMYGRVEPVSNSSCCLFLPIKLLIEPDVRTFLPAVLLARLVGILFGSTT